MVHTIHRVKEFLRYQQRAQTKYYIHSPFVYQFYLNVLEGEKLPQQTKIDRLRHTLLQTYDKILIEDMGAQPGAKEKTISQLTSTASIPEKYGKVLYNLARYFQPQSVLELGTCLGLGTAYIAIAAPNAAIVTMEGSKTLSDRAAQNFNVLGIHNVACIVGNFDEELPQVLSGIDKIDMAFIDGNHRYEPTLGYFHMLMAKAYEETILVFDDIYWSPEMTAAWDAIKKDPRISLTIDIHRFGIVFMHRDKLAKEDFVLRY